MNYLLIRRVFAYACPSFVRLLVFLFPIFLWTGGLRATGVPGLVKGASHDIKSVNTQYVYVSFPDDITVAFCDVSLKFPEPEISSRKSQYITTYIDKFVTSASGACLRIERTWNIVSHPQSISTNTNVYYVNNPENSNIGAILSPVNTPLSEGRPKNKPVSVTSWLPFGATPAGRAERKLEPKNETFANSGRLWSNAFEIYGLDINTLIYTQIITIADTNTPIATDPGCGNNAETITCGGQQVVPDTTTNLTVFWNDSDLKFIDPHTGTTDQGEAPANIFIDVAEMCPGAKVNIRYELMLDLDHDGDLETVVNSAAINTIEPGTVVMGNATINEPFVVVRFDKRSGETRSYSDVNDAKGIDGTIAVPSDRYHFILETRPNGNRTRASVRWRRANSDTAASVQPLLPHGRCKIRWFLSDSCGNQRTCEYTIASRDCGKPKLVCKRDLAVNLGPYYASFIQISTPTVIQTLEDNCTKAGQIKYAIRRGEGTTYPTDRNGNVTNNITLTCEDTIPVHVEVWARDLAGNISKCSTKLMMQDTNNNCWMYWRGVFINGNISTETQKPLENAVVKMTMLLGHDDLRDIVNHFATKEKGDYTAWFSHFFLRPILMTPQKNDDPLNGITTFDLALLSKHLLGIQPLNSPYKLIAADVDSSGTLSNFDVIELRKLILGIYDKLPKNTVWRFVNKSFTFPNPDNPFATPIPSGKLLNSLTFGGRYTEDFIAIKIGDMDDDAATNPLTKAETRSTGILLFDVEDRELKVGEIVTVALKATEPVAGYQFTLNTPGLDVLDIVPSAGMSKDNFAVFAQKQAITTSFDGKTAGEFSITFRANTSGRLSQMLQVSNQITEAAAFTEAAEHWNIALRFNSHAGQTIAEASFELYQNAPNPWTDKTSIGFYLPESDRATLTVFDQTGRVLFVQKGDFGKGKNTIVVDRTYLNQGGLLYYKLETAKHAATRKMIEY